MMEYYQKEYPQVWNSRREAIEQSIVQLQAIYNKNVFPAMKVYWGTYSNNIGHSDFPGCFRCHDDNHKSATGKVISQDCSTCHSLLAVEEAKPGLIPEIFTKK